jgi:hypothetical protein
MNGPDGKGHPTTCLSNAAKAVYSAPVLLVRQSVGIFIGARCARDVDCGWERDGIVHASVTVEVNVDDEYPQAWKAEKTTVFEARGFTLQIGGLPRNHNGIRLAT